MGDWCSKEVGGTYGMDVWKCIRRGWEGFAQHVRFDIGDGTKVLFWHEVWCGEHPLKLVYPDLFNIACNKDVWVKECMERPNDILHWNVQLFLPVHDWELEEVTHFFALLYSQKIRCGGEDKICWIPSKRNTFDVKSYYKSLSTLTPVFAPWKSIWKVKASTRVAFFVWTATVGKILTLDNLRKRNVMVMECCYMCKS
jgi:hypothetical protein